MNRKTAIPGSISKTIGTALLLALLTGCGWAHRAPQGAAGPGVREPVPAPGEVSPEPAPGRAGPADSPPPLDPETAVEEAYFEAIERVADPELVPGETTSESPHDALAEVDPELSEEELARERHLVIVEPPTFDIPIETNERVLGWVDYYSNRHREQFRPGLVRSGRYIEKLREIFAEAGVPQDLAYMAHVESAYKTTAYSRARAKGIFQFIAATGRRYGLRIDYWVDERSDPEKSARAAAAYLKDLHGEFGDWYLAMAGYNAGEGKIRRALDHTKRKDFWGIARTRYIGRETKNYVPAVLAAMLISKEPAKYGFDIELDAPVQYELIEIEGAVDLRVLAECAGSDLETLQALNPALRRQQTPPQARTVVNVPLEAGERTLAALAQVPAAERVLYARHRVRSGDTLYDLARVYGVSVSAIQQANRLGRSTLIRPGQELVVPTVASRYATEFPTYDGASDGQVLTYRVRRGDTLYGIARRYGTTPAAIAAASGIHVNELLQIGQPLIVVPRVSTTEEVARVIGGVQPESESDAARTHTVRRGENLWRIATRYRTTVAHLCKLNSISADATLYPGTQLAVSTP